MLGSATQKLFLQASKNEIISTSRNRSANSTNFDARNDSVAELIKQIEPDWIVNCIGVIKPHINEASYASTLNAIRINSIFPHMIAEAIEGKRTKVIQIATDCVFSGKLGMYTENNFHDALDVYGKTKSLGEVNSPNFMHIRASIIGPEYGRSTSLLEWFLGQGKAAEVNGFTDHLWNGVTTHHFAKIALAISETGLFESGIKHVIPGNIVTKAELLETFKEVYNRADIKVNHVESSNRIDRTLSTENLGFSNNVWAAAGYPAAPSVEEMVREQHEFNNLHK
jgi:dTDP-4-dehydrorhamnose reductase